MCIRDRDYVICNQVSRQKAKNPVESKMWKDMNNKLYGAMTISMGSKPNIDAIVDYKQEAEDFDSFNKRKRKNPFRDSSTEKVKLYEDYMTSINSLSRLDALYDAKKDSITEEYEKTWRSLKSWLVQKKKERERS